MNGSGVERKQERESMTREKVQAELESIEKLTFKQHELSHSEATVRLLGMISAQLVELTERLATIQTLLTPAEVPADARPRRHRS